MRELDDVFRIEVGGVLGEAGAAGVFDALIDGQDGQVTGSRQAAGTEQSLQVAENPGVAIAGNKNAIDKVGAGQMERLLGDRLAHMLQEAFSLGT